jgi:hypothetical protein
LLPQRQVRQRQLTVRANSASERPKMIASHLTMRRRIPDQLAERK